MDKRSYWHKHSEDWEESDLTQQAYCTLHKLRYNRFSYWRHKFNQQQKVGTAEIAQFTQLSIEDDKRRKESTSSVSNKHALTLQFKNLALNFTQQSDPIWLSQVISELSKLSTDRVTSV